MKSPDERTILRRRQSDLTDDPETRNDPQSTGSVTYLGKVVRDDALWPYVSAPKSPLVPPYAASPASAFPARPPFVAMTNPLGFAAAETEGATATETVGTDRVPVLCTSEAPIDGTRVIAKDIDGRWATDDAFGGYLRVYVLSCESQKGFSAPPYELHYGFNDDAATAEITFDGLDSPPVSLTGTADWSVANESTQTISFTALTGPVTGGSFILGTPSPGVMGIPAWQSDPIAFDATAAGVQAALTASGSPLTGVTCTGGPLPGTPVTIAGPIPTYTATPVNVVTPIKLISSVVSGGGLNQITRVVVSWDATGGTYRLVCGPSKTDPIPWNATTDDVRAILERHPKIGPGNVRVTDSYDGFGPGTYFIELVGLRAEAAIAITLDVSTFAVTGINPGIPPTVSVANVQSVAANTVSLHVDDFAGEFDGLHNKYTPSFPFRTRGPFAVVANGGGLSASAVTLPRAGRPNLNLIMGVTGSAPAVECSTCFGIITPVLRIAVASGTYDLTPQYNFLPNGGPRYVTAWQAVVPEAYGDITTYTFGCFGDGNPLTFGDASPWVIAVSNTAHCTGGFRAQWSGAGANWWTNPSRPYPSRPLSMSFTLTNSFCGTFSGTATIYEP